jgi:hypothetical protein
VPFCFACQVHKKRWEKLFDCLESRDPEQIKGAFQNLEDNDPMFSEQMLTMEVGERVLLAASERGLFSTIKVLVGRGTPVGTESIVYWHGVDKEVGRSEYLEGLAIFITEGAVIPGKWKLGYSRENRTDSGYQLKARTIKQNNASEDLRGLILEQFIPDNDKAKRELFVMLLDQHERTLDSWSNTLLTKYKLNAEAVQASSHADIIALVASNMDEWLRDLIQILFRAGAHEGSAVNPTLRASVMSHFAE